MACPALGRYAVIRPPSLCPEVEGAPPQPDSPVPAPGLWGVLRHRHFRNVWFAAFISNTGNWMELLGVQTIVAHETRSPVMMGYLGAVQLVPILILGIWGGLVADRVNRRTLLVITQTILMLIAAALAVLAHLDLAHVKVLFGLAALQGVVMAFNIPAWQVLTPRLVPRAELTQAITLNGLQFNASRVLGPALAGMLLAQTGPAPLFIVNTLSFLAVVIAAARTPDAPAPPPTGVAAWPQIREAAAFIFRSRGPLCVFIAMVLMSMLAAPLMRMLPLYVIDVYGLAEGPADHAAGWLIAVLGVGAVIGAVLLRYVPTWYPKHHFIPVSLAGAGLTIAVFSLSTTLPAGLAAMLFVGLFWIWGFNQSWAAMQNLVPDQMRGRVMAIANVASFGATAFGNVVSGWIGGGAASVLSDPGIGTQLALGLPAYVLLLAGIVMMIWRVPEVDSMPRVPNPDFDRWDLLGALTAKEHRPRRSAAPLSPQPPAGA